MNALLAKFNAAGMWQQAGQRDSYVLDMANASPSEASGGGCMASCAQGTVNGQTHADGADVFVMES